MSVHMPYVAEKSRRNRNGRRRTLPSAQSIMSSKGKLARGMVVVCHHIGRPRQRTISQNANIIWERLRTSDGFSGGGCLRPFVVVVVDVNVVGAGGTSTSSTASTVEVTTSAVSVVLVSTVLIVMSTLWAAVADMAAQVATWHRKLYRDRG